MQTLVLTVHVLLAISVIGLVLLQQGRGADAGAAFGSGASSTVFGAAGSGSFLTRMTTLCAALFFATSLGLAVIAANRSGESDSVIDQAPAQAGPQEQAQQPGSQESQPPDVPSGGATDLPPVDGQ